MTLLLSSKDSQNYNEESIRLFFSSFYQFAKQNLNQKLINSCLIQFVLDYATLINRSFYNDILKLINNISDQKTLTILLKIFIHLINLIFIWKIFMVKIFN